MSKIRKVRPKRFNKVRSVVLGWYSRPDLMVIAGKSPEWAEVHNWKIDTNPRNGA